MHLTYLHLQLLHNKSQFPNECNTKKYTYNKYSRTFVIYTISLQLTPQHQTIPPLPTLMNNLTTYHLHTSLAVLYQLGTRTVIIRIRISISVSITIIHCSCIKQWNITTS